MAQKTKTLRLMPKDNNGEMDLTGVTGFALEGPTLLVVFETGRTRNFPLQHLAYYESEIEGFNDMRVEPMLLTLSGKDNLNKETHTGVMEFRPQGETLMIVWYNGMVRNYPLMHLWYYESHVEFHKSSPLVEM